MANDIFCDKEKIEPDILAETKNWMIKLGFGLVTPGHVMAIPKQHFDCLADVSLESFDEFDNLVSPLVQRYLSETFSTPFGVEYGIFGQTVKHAHIHFIPKAGEGYSITDAVTQINSEGELIFEKMNREQLRNIRLDGGKYVLVLEGKDYFVYPIPLNMSEDEYNSLNTKTSYRNFIRKIGAKVPLSWERRTSEEIERDDLWREITREKFKGLAGKLF